MISMQNYSPQTTYVRDLPYTGIQNYKNTKYKIQSAKFLPSDHLCERLALHWDGQRLSRPARVPHRREDIARRLHQVLAQYLKYSMFSIPYNMFLQLPNLWGTWSGPICRWCLPLRTGTCWGGRWSTWPGLALSPAWGWPAGLMIKKLSVRPLFQLFSINCDLSKTPIFPLLRWPFDQAVHTLCPHPGSTLETPTEQSSTKTELPASCLPSPRLRLSPDIFFWLCQIYGLGRAIHSPVQTCLIARPKPV